MSRVSLWRPGRRRQCFDYRAAAKFSAARAARKQILQRRAHSLAGQDSRLDLLELCGRARTHRGAVCRRIGSQLEQVPDLPQSKAQILCLTHERQPVNRLARIASIRTMGPRRLGEQTPALVVAHCLNAHAARGGNFSDGQPCHASPVSRPDPRLRSVARYGVKPASPARPIGAGRISGAGARLHAKDRAVPWPWSRRREEVGGLTCAAGARAVPCRPVARTLCASQQERQSWSIRGNRNFSHWAQRSQSACCACTSDGAARSRILPTLRAAVPALSALQRSVVLQIGVCAPTVIRRMRRRWP